MTTKLCRTSRHSQNRTLLPAQTTCDIPERIFRTQISFHLIPVPRLRLGGQKHPKPVPSGSLGTLYIPMWRTLYQKRGITRSSNFRQRTANEEHRHRHPWLDLHFIPTTSLLHHRNVRRHTSDRHPGHSDSFYFISFVLWVSNRAPLGYPGRLHLAVDGCMDFERPHALFEHLCCSCVFQIPSPSFVI